MGRKYNDLAGHSFGDVVVLGIDESSGGAGKHKRWVCECTLCGKKFTAESSHLKNGEITKCRVCANRSSATTHGSSKERLYRIWVGMKQRCYHKNNPNWAQWGGRGISICDDWGAGTLDINGYLSFREWSLANGYDDSKSIDRINNDLDYNPTNCRWADRQTQNSNTRQNVQITIDGVTHTAAEWSRITGLKPDTIRQRFHHGKTGAAIIAPI